MGPMMRVKHEAVIPQRAHVSSNVARGAVRAIRHPFHRRKRSRGAQRVRQDYRIAHDMAVVDRKIDEALRAGYLAGVPEKLEIVAVRGVLLADPPGRLGADQ